MSCDPHVPSTLQHPYVWVAKREMQGKCWRPPFSAFDTRGVNEVWRTRREEKILFWGGDGKRKLKFCHLFSGRHTQNHLIENIKDNNYTFSSPKDIFSWVNRVHTATKAINPTARIKSLKEIWAFLTAHTRLDSQKVPVVFLGRFTLPSSVQLGRASLLWPRPWRTMSAFLVCATDLNWIQEAKFTQHWQEHKGNF